jgi:EAL domain-containing protein (putative c-di-GMP-specific phosphodiesterase class I)
VRRLGVHHAQGYMISRPMPAGELHAWWSSWRSGRMAETAVEG